MGDQQAPAGWYDDPTSPGRTRYWDGAAWTEHLGPPQVVTQPPAFAPQASPPQWGGQPPAAQHSPAAQYPPAPAQAAAMPPNTCKICGRTPIAQIEIKKQAGLVLARQTTKWSGPVCRDCGLALARQYQSHTLLAGWWGFFSFFLNPFTIFKNLTAFRRLRPLTTPQGAPLAPPMNPGRPVWLRPGFLVAIGLAVLLGLVIREGITHTDVNQLSVGECINVPDSASFNSVESLDCTSPHDAQVVGKVGSATMGSIDPCVAMAQSVVKSGPSDLRVSQIVMTAGSSDVICVVARQSGEKLTTSVM